MEGNRCFPWTGNALYDKYGGIFIADNPILLPLDGRNYIPHFVVGIGA